MTTATGLSTKPKKLLVEMFTRFLLLILVLFSGALHGQTSDPLIFTVGQSYTTQDGSQRNFILWQGGDAQSTFGKSYAIYRKSGGLNSAGTFSRVSVQGLQTAPSALFALLKLGSEIDHDADRLPGRIHALAAEAQGQPLPANATMPTELSLQSARDLGTIMTSAQEDSEILQSLMSLGRAHPGVMVSLGQAFIEEAPTGTATYEVRELNVTNDAIRVIGRVAIDPGAPFQLVPPGRPHQVFHPVDPALQLAASAKDHLNALLRWSQSDELRNLLPKSYGFNLYRIEEKFAPDPSAITTESQLLAAGGIRVNELPIAGSERLTEAEASDASFQPETFFYADDKNPPSDQFKNGEQFYYYAALRDIAGVPGPLSPPTLVTMTDRIPPAQASIERVENVFDFDTSQPEVREGNQHLRVVIRQVPEQPENDAAGRYLVYRWHAATDWQLHGGDPSFNLAGTVDHVPGETFAVFDDVDLSDTDIDYVSADQNGPDTGTPFATGENSFDIGRTYWYTVRSEDNAAVMPKNLSGHSGANYGVLRDRVGPENPGGTVEYCAAEALISVNPEIRRAQKAGFGLAADYQGLVATLDRSTGDMTNPIDRLISSMDVEVGFRDGSNNFISIYERSYSFSSLQSRIDLPVPLEPRQGGYLVRSRSRIDQGTTSDWLEEPLSILPSSDSQISWLEFKGSSRTTKEVYTPGSGPAPHSNLGPDGSLTGVSGRIPTPPDVYEVRVYRRVMPSGPLQMIKREAGIELTRPFMDFEEEAATLAPGTEVCYYSQLFDQDGNPSALRLEACIRNVNQNFGAVLLSQPELLTSVGAQNLYKLEWFADPTGVDRFEVLIAQDDGSPVTVSSQDLTAFTSATAGGKSPDLVSLSRAALPSSAFVTSRLQSGFGSEGTFSVNLVAPAASTLHYAVRPVGRVTQGKRPEGALSNIVTGYAVDPVTQAPPGFQSVIPWPARPLVGASSVTRPLDSYLPGEGPLYASTIPEVAMNFIRASGAIFVGIHYKEQRESEGQRYISTFAPGENPNDSLFKLRPGGGSSTELESLLPFVVYRHQVPSARFPSAAANLTQVTPLIEGISHQRNSSTNTSVARDPFFLFQDFNANSIGQLEIPLEGVFSRDPGTYQTDIPNIENLRLLNTTDHYAISTARDNDFGGEGFPIGIWVKDPLPAARGASYQYLIVHFTERGEIETVIPTNTITH